MQGMFYGAFQGKKKDMLPLLSKLGEKRGDRDHMLGVIFQKLHLPDDWPELGDEDWVKARFASGGSMNINYLEGPLFSVLSDYLLPVEGLTVTQTLDYGVKTYTYSPYGSLEILSFERKDQVRSAARPFERETGQSSVIQDRQSWSDYETANAKDLIPDGVLPPPRTADSPFLLQKGVLVKYLGHEEEAAVPESCTAIGPRAFQDCRELKRVTVPKTVKTIGEEAFSGCSALEDVELAQGLEALGGGAFWGTKLRRIELPEGLSYVGFLCFPDGVFLKIPASLTKLDGQTVQKLAGAEVAGGNSAYFSQDGALYARTQTGAVLLRVPQTVQGIFEIPDGVQAIGENAFYCCRKLTGVGFPAGLTKIGRDAFGGCGALESVELPEGLVTIESGAFEYCKLRSVRFPASLKTIGSYAFQTVIGGDATALKRVELPEGVQCGKDAFDEDTVLAADLASEAARQRLSLQGQAVELSLTPGRDYTGLVTPAVLAYFVDRDAAEALTQLEPFAPELWELLPDLLCHARCRGAQKAERRLLELEQEGQAQGKKRKPPTAAQLKKLWWVRDNPDGTCTIWDYRGPSLHPVLPAAIGKRTVAKWEFTFGSGRIPSALDQIVTLTLPATLTKFDCRRWDRARLLERIEVEAGNPAYRSRDGVLFSVSGTKLLLYPCGRREARYEIPEGVRSIAKWAFQENAALREVVFPASLKKVDEEAFDSELAQDLTIRAPAGSCWEDFAQEHEISFQPL